MQNQHADPPVVPYVTDRPLGHEILGPCACLGPHGSQDEELSNLIARRLLQGSPADYPGFIEPARPNLKKIATSGDWWLHEIKWDSYPAARVSLLVLSQRFAVRNSAGNFGAEEKNLRGVV
jgi:hypothetical protein